MPVAYEPMQLSAEKKTKTSVTCSPSFVKLQVATTLKPTIGLAINETYGYGASNTEAMVVYFKNKEKISFEVGGGMGFQDNNTNKMAAISGMTADNQGGERSPFWYSNVQSTATYQTAFLCGAIFFSPPEAKRRFGFSLKTGGAYIYNYNYNITTYTRDKYIGDLPPADVEQIHFKNRMFFTSEISALYKRTTKFGGFRMQFGYNYCSPAVEHIYYFEERALGANNQIISGDKTHPVYSKVFFSVGLIFNIDKTKTTNALDYLK